MLTVKQKIHLGWKTHPTVWRLNSLFSSHHHLFYTFFRFSSVIISNHSSDWEKFAYYEYDRLSSDEEEQDDISTHDGTDV